MPQTSYERTESRPTPKETGGILTLWTPEPSALLKGVSARLLEARRVYLAALLTAVDFLAAQAEHDPVARELVEEVELARTRLVAGNLLVRCEFGL